MAYLLVNLKFRQRVDFITRVTLFCAFCFRSLGFQQQSLGKYTTRFSCLCANQRARLKLWNDARA